MKINFKTIEKLTGPTIVVIVFVIMFCVFFMVDSNYIKARNMDTVYYKNIIDTIYQGRKNTVILDKMGLKSRTDTLFNNFDKGIIVVITHTDTLYRRTSVDIIRTK